MPPTVTNKTSATVIPHLRRRALRFGHAQIGRTFSCSLSGPGPILHGVRSSALGFSECLPGQEWASSPPIPVLDETLAAVRGPSCASRSLPLVVVVLLWVTGCEDATDPLVPPSVEKNNGFPTTAEVAQAVAAGMTVLDQNGNGLSGIAVSWTVVSGGGTVSTPRQGNLRPREH